LDRSDYISLKNVADVVFSKAHRENKKDRFYLADFKNWKSLTGSKLVEAVAELNDVLKQSGEVFVRRDAKKSNQRTRQLHGFARVEIVKPGGHYREAKLKILVSDDYKIQNPDSKVHPKRVREIEFTSRYFDKVKIMNFADHKIKTAAVYYPEKEDYTPPEEQLYAPTGHGGEKKDTPSSGFEFGSLYEDLPYFNQDK
jgi:hypothetical protein